MGHYEDVLCLFAKRLERGRFVWPQASDGAVSLTRAQADALRIQVVTICGGCEENGKL
jgi:transposase